MRLPGYNLPDVFEQGPDHTIASIATAAGGGIGIIRMSGPEAVAIALTHFRGLPQAWRARRLYHGWWHDGAGVDLDEGLVVVMPGPRSYTGEDVVELQLHGGPLGLRRAVEVCWAAGARPARPGEFTRRAFLNGRMDLTQAEAVADLVGARTDNALRQARQQLAGDLYRAAINQRERLIDLRARLEVNIDFVDEDVPLVDPAGLAADARAGAGRATALAATFEQGRLLREGARVALTGPVNVGKSSLFNALCQQDRAIVTPIAGTTRDTLEETVDLLGVPVSLIDTAGLRETWEPVEAEGIARARRAADGAHLTLHVVDVTSDAPPQRTPAVEDALVVASKADLPARWPLDGAIPVSAKTGEGLHVLRRAIVTRLGGHPDAESGGVVVSRERHRSALVRCAEALNEAADGLEAGAPPELVAVDVQEAADALAELVGLTTVDDVLDRLFSTFCIGK